MIEIANKQDCCGCSACVQRCPKQCISLVEDEEGFLYPKVNKESCLDCGICEDVCPLANGLEPTSPLSFLAAKNRNEEERMRSSSGGMFISLAREVIKEGGVVFGVSFNDAWEGVFSSAETMDDVLPMMGSKYFQAKVGNAYQDAERFLKEGRKVLFSGCPCQLAGLHKFLRKGYDNLISVDLLCHGVSSPGVWRRYLAETLLGLTHKWQIGKNTVLSSSLNSMPDIMEIKFRDKQQSGWGESSFVIRGKSALEPDGKNTILLSYNLYTHPTIGGFLSNLYLRPSCYACRCKKGRSHSDVTIGDFWGIGEAMPDFDDDKGVSLVLINTQKGKDIFNRLDMEVRVSSREDATLANGGVEESIKEHPKRELFFKLYHREVSILDAINTCLNGPIHIRALKCIVKKILGRNNVKRIKKVRQRWRYKRIR